MTRGERWGVAAIFVLFAAVYILYGLFRHWAFYTSLDMAIFDQAVWHLARFEAPASSIKGLANIFGDHFHPIIVFFAPAYWVAPGPESLIVIQGLLLAGAILPMYVFLRRRLPAGPALALCATYGFFWGIQHAAAFDVHEVAFAPLVTAWAVLAMDSRRWISFWIAMAAVMLVKENLIPLAGFFGLLLIMQGRRRQGAALIGISLVVFVGVMRWLVPWLSGADSPYMSLYTDILRRPWLLPAALVTPPGKITAVALWLGPFVFMPLASPLALLLVPVALALLLPTTAAYWGVSFHHAAPLAALLTLSAGDGLARLARGLRTPGAQRQLRGWVAGISVLLSAILPGNQPFWDLFSLDHFRPHPNRSTWTEMSARIPHDASVVAQAALLPHLSHRRTLYLLDQEGKDADLLAASMRLSPWPGDDHHRLTAWIDAKRQAGYRTIFERDGWVLLERPAPGGGR